MPEAAQPIRRHMELVWIGFTLFSVVSTAVGLRLVSLWWRTRELPELLIGLGVLGIGPVGFGLLTLGIALGDAGHPAAAPVAALGSAACTAGALAKYVFNWRVYHPSRGYVAIAVALICATSLALSLVHMLGHGFPHGREHPDWYLGRGVLQVGCLLWGAAEALAYSRRMRKRVALGIADPLVANRFLLWGIAAAAAGFGTLVGLCAFSVMREAAMLEPWVLASSSAHGVVAALAMGLAFFPPRAYRAHFEQRSTRRA